MKNLFYTSFVRAFNLSSLTYKFIFSPYFFSAVRLSLIVILLIYNTETVYCMENNNEAFNTTPIGDEDSNKTSVNEGKANKFAFNVNLTDAFKYAGAGAAAAGAGAGLAKVLKTLPPQARAGTTIAATAFVSGAVAVTKSIESIYGSSSASSSKSNVSLGGEFKPEISGNANIKIGEHTKVNIESSNSSLTSIHPQSGETINPTPSGKVEAISSVSPKTDFIPSIFEDFSPFSKISEWATNDPFTVLLYCILLFSCIGLYMLIALNIGYLISKGSDSAISKIKNPIILRILNYYTKYNAALFWFWFLMIYCCFLMLIFISLVLIDNNPFNNFPVTKTSATFTWFVM